MPPPLLSRHLRPCRFPWRAQQARRAASTPHAKLSTAADDRRDTAGRKGYEEGEKRHISETPTQGCQPNADQNGASQAADARHQKKSWWRAALEIINSPGPARVQADSSTQAPLGDNNGRGEPGLQATQPAQDTNPHRPPADSLKVTRDQKIEASGTIIGHRDMDLDRMQQQIQELYEDVKMIRAALQVNPAMAMPLSEIVSKQVASAHRQAAPEVRNAQPEHHPQPTTPQAANEPRRWPYSQRRGSGFQNFLYEAQRKYGRSTTELVRTANELDEVMPKTGASIIDLIHKRLSLIGQEALREEDRPLLVRLQEYRRLHELGIVPEKIPVEDTPLVRRARKVYSESVSTLAEVLRSIIDSINPAPVSQISALIRDRLVLLGQAAITERDTRTLQRLARRGVFKERLFDHPSDAPASLSFMPAYESQRPRDGFKTTPATQSLRQGTTAPARSHENSEKYRVKSPKNVPKSEPSGGRTNEGKESTLQTKIRYMTKGGQVPGPTQGAHAHSSTNPPDHAKDATPDSAKRKQPQHSSDTKPASASTDGPEDARSSPIKKPKSRRQEPAKDSKAKPSTTAVTTPTPVVSRVDASDKQSLLEELFPEANLSPPTRQPDDREQYPKLDPPENTKLIGRQLVDRPLSKQEQIVQSFQKSGEKITVLQLVHCSTELTESDFRRLIPKAKNTGFWNDDGAFYKVIPGRDPLSMERLPFYYLLFKSPEAAHAYQKNAGRLHKLSALHQPSNIFSAIPAPKGFLEDGEDLEAATSSYLLKPTEHALELRMLMQPYHPALRTLFEQEGYRPIVPSLDNTGNRIFKVLMHIEGYEPTPMDLFKILQTDAYLRGTSLSLRNESDSSIHRLRDLINLKTRTLPITSTRPRQSTSSDLKVEFEDPTIGYLLQGSGTIEVDDAKGINQEVMSRAYNRWILDFDDEDEARRFAVSWHRRDLLKISEKGWKDHQQQRTCNCELLW